MRLLGGWVLAVRPSDDRASDSGARHRDVHPRALTSVVALRGILRLLVVRVFCGILMSSSVWARRQQTLERLQD